MAARIAELEGRLAKGISLTFKGRFQIPLEAGIVGRSAQDRIAESPARKSEGRRDRENQRPLRPAKHQPVKEAKRASFLRLFRDGSRTEQIG